MSVTTGETLTASALAFATGAVVGISAFVGFKIIKQQFSKSKKPVSATKRCLELGADVMQNFDAPKQHTHGFHVHGFHCYAKELKQIVEAHHFCSHLTEDFCQCVIYDSDKPNARLIGIEYIISRKLFETLPEDEQKLWHSHVGEVKKGILCAPGLPQAAEHKLMEHVVNTYGKTFHLWKVDEGDDLPLGMPNLMMSFTEDAPQEEFADVFKIRDEKMGVSQEKLIENRKDIEALTPHPNADAWSKTGKSAYVTRAYRRVEDMKKPQRPAIDAFSKD